MRARYIVNEDGKHVSVLLPKEEYDRIVEALEDLDDVRAYDEAKSTLARGEHEVVPLDQAMREIREVKVVGD